jgi:hypothetical protein
MAMHLRERIFDELRRVADRDAGQQIKIDGDAGELIEMIHCLRPDDLLVDVTARNGTRSDAVPVVVVIAPPPNRRTERSHSRCCCARTNY